MPPRLSHTAATIPDMHNQMQKRANVGFSIVTTTETQECSTCWGVRRIRLRGLEAAGVAWTQRSGSWDRCSHNSSDIHPSRVLTSLASIPFNPLFLTHLQPAYGFLLTCFLTPSPLIPRFHPGPPTFHWLPLSCLVLTVFRVGKKAGCLF